MGFVISLNVLNPDAFIVRQNIARYWAGGDLDARYLESLSADAVPALVTAMTSAFPAGAADPREACETELAKVLQEGLEDRPHTMKGDPGWHHWQSARLSTWLAYRQLSRLFAASVPGSS